MKQALLITCIKLLLSKINILFIMESRLKRTEIVTVKLPNGKDVKIEATLLQGEEEVANKILSFENISDVIEGIAAAVAAPLQKIQPTKASIKLGLEVAVESGQLTTLIVKGSSKANLELILEWEKQDI
ncbi:MAG TPA: CU044_2847 family protein [Nostoc sp.]|uniref:CU044_2847 family protein n=1 Tax=Nostoc sp. TaxID=1180 RepID=UPI002D27CE37|nr:CU044_2847 family protein [Nostoc sp.]HYX16798.1 CU044_2847 family protein [Nostoc sp.]